MATDKDTQDTPRKRLPYRRPATNGTAQAAAIAPERLRVIAMAALTEVAENQKAAPAARAAAARTILESLGVIGRLQELARASDKSTTELSPAELNHEIARLTPKRRR